MKWNLAAPAAELTITTAGVANAADSRAVRVCVTAGPYTDTLRFACNLAAKQASKSITHRK